MAYPGDNSVKTNPGRKKEMHAGFVIAEMTGDFDSTCAISDKIADSRITRSATREIGGGAAEGTVGGGVASVGGNTIPPCRSAGEGTG